MLNFSPIVRPMKSRGSDRYGSGQPGSPRDHGSRAHKGLDLIASPNQQVFSPMRGNIIREAFPYKNDHSLRGILVRGIDEFSGYEMKLFYVNGLFSGLAIPGQIIGHAMDLSKKYPGITNHVHFEMTFKGASIDPRSCFLSCF